MSREGSECRRSGFVSVWAGTFSSVEAAESYFGIPDEIGVYLPPEAFARDLGLDDLPPESLEVNFEQIAPRPLRELLRDATFAASFIDQAIEAARRQGIHEAQGIALLYDFDYQGQPGGQGETGSLFFIGSFPFARTSAAEPLDPVPDPRIHIHDITDDLL